MDAKSGLKSFLNLGNLSSAPARRATLVDLSTADGLAAARTSFAHNTLHRCTQKLHVGVGASLARIPARRKKGLIHGLVRQDLLERQAVDLVRKNQPMIGRADIEVRHQIAAIA